MLLVILLAGFWLDEWPLSERLALTTVGWAIALAGLVLFGLGVAAHRGSVTPLPRPRTPVRIVDSGAYRFARHPIYGGLVLLAVGFSIARVSLVALGLSVALAVLFDRKANVEERWLARLAPEYAAYRERVRRRFVPYLF